MLTVNDPQFRPYGRVLKLDLAAFEAAIKKVELPKDGTMYEPSTPAFEALPLFTELQDKIFGELPIEFGHCSGRNHKLNAVEYHRSSEVDIAATDLYLMLGKQQDIDPATFHYETKRIETFFVPAGTAVELYATTLHFAPCSAGPDAEFRCGVVLPRGTNVPLVNMKRGTGEDRLLFANNKWLIAHAESGLEKDGAFVGLVGDNLTL
ncbi:DUF4867 family protein [uncultured Selenomonas sp.]|uniref:DUF4867 family protein n=1 Tax=uncultured Selenomonas sp. TaxID=159275 RepID=UPI0025DAF6EE|nr:DUF4867 family protein [uncultured Selenomonas sp.]